MVKCKNCKEEMQKRGFRRNNERWECDNCNLRYVSFMERHFGVNFEGYPKWSKISDDNNIFPRPKG